MRRCQAAPSDHAELLIALAKNLRLWTIFQSSVADPGCALPDEIRVNVLALAEFVDRRTAEIVGAPAADKLAALININEQLAAA